MDVSELNGAIRNLPYVCPLWKISEWYLDTGKGGYEVVEIKACTVKLKYNYDEQGDGCLAIWFKVLTYITIVFPLIVWIIRSIHRSCFNFVGVTSKGSSEQTQRVEHARNSALPASGPLADTSQMLQAVGAQNKRDMEYYNQGPVRQSDGQRFNPNNYLEIGTAINDMRADIGLFRMDLITEDRPTLITKSNALIQKYAKLYDNQYKFHSLSSPAQISQNIVSSVGDDIQRAIKCNQSVKELGEQIAQDVLAPLYPDENQWPLELPNTEMIQFLKKTWTNEIVVVAFFDDKESLNVH